MVRCILTAGAQQFITPLSAAALSGEKPIPICFLLPTKARWGILRLAQESDLVIVAPASADLLAKMAGGLADDLASTALLATDKPVLIAPAMNFRMWEHQATQANLALLDERGVKRIGPKAGPLAAMKTAWAAWPSRWRSSPRRAEFFSLRPPCREVARWSPAARRMSRSIRCATSPIAPRVSRARDCHGTGTAGRGCVLVSGPTEEPRPARRQSRPRLDRARDAGRLRSRIAGRGRGLCRRCCRLARRSRARETQEESRRAAGAETGRESRHPRDARPRGQPPAALWSSALPPRPRT